MQHVKTCDSIFTSMAYIGPKVFYIILTTLVFGALTVGGVFCAIPTFDLATAKVTIPNTNIELSISPFECALEVPLVSIPLLHFNYST